MHLTIPERRRAPRATLGTASWFAAPTTYPVQVVDMSLGGLAFASPYELPVGRTASIRTTLGREAFSGDIRICWVKPADSAAAHGCNFRVGAVFLPLEDRCRRVLESFLASSSER